MQFQSEVIPSCACSAEGSGQQREKGLLIQAHAECHAVQEGAHELDMRMDLRKSSAITAALVFTCARVASRLECT